MERSEGIVMQWYEIISASKNKLSKLRTLNKSSLRQPDEMSTDPRSGCRHIADGTEAAQLGGHPTHISYSQCCHGDLHTHP